MAAPQPGCMMYRSPHFRDTPVSCPVNDTIDDWPFPDLEGSNVGAVA